MRLWKARPPKGPELDPTPVSIAHLTDPALREAYARGRRDERARHRRSPMMVAAFSLAAVVGAALLASAAVRGSFESGGALVDRQIVTAAEEAKPALAAAAHNAGRALKGEGRANTAAAGG